MLKRERDKFEKAIAADNGLRSRNGKNRTLRPCRGRLEPKRRRKTSLERLFAGSRFNLITFFFRLVCGASAESVGNCSSAFRAWRTIFSVS